MSDDDEKKPLQIRVVPNVGQERELPKDDGQTSAPDLEAAQRAALEGGCDGQKAPGRMVYRRLEQMGEYLHTRKIGLVAGIAFYAFNCEKKTPTVHFHVDINTYGVPNMTPEQRGAVINGLEHVLAEFKKQQS